MTMGIPTASTYYVKWATVGLGAGYPIVAGRCPSCGLSALFLDRMCHVVCATPSCANPQAAERAMTHGDHAVQDLKAIYDRLQQAWTEPANKVTLYGLIRDLETILEGWELA